MQNIAGACDMGELKSMRGRCLIMGLPHSFRDAFVKPFFLSRAAPYTKEGECVRLGHETDYRG
ncbi:hypothetical protein A6U86_00895 [Rhizobium sp. AC27/96]|nr:hypothetical protein A6U86_00895 [Rhizobium sp. AC27/96]